MQIRWKFVVFISGFVFVLSLAAFLSRKTALANPPQATAPATASASAKSAGDAVSATLSIPDTTSAINSSTPMSQRVVHYEIDANYDATKHTIDATEVLTYHNLTGQPLDHFPFHLYQNAFQPKATWVREAKQEGSRDTAYRQVGRQGIRFGRHQEHRSGRARRSDFEVAIYSAR